MNIQRAPIKAIIFDRDNCLCAAAPGDKDLFAFSALEVRSPLQAFLGQILSSHHGQPAHA